jgi:hypothetical protein
MATLTAEGALSGGLFFIESDLPVGQKSSRAKNLSSPLRKNKSFRD